MSELNEWKAFCGKIIKWVCLCECFPYRMSLLALIIEDYEQMTLLNITASQHPKHGELFHYDHAHGLESGSGSGSIFDFGSGSGSVSGSTFISGSGSQTVAAGENEMATPNTAAAGENEPDTSQTAAAEHNEKRAQKRAQRKKIRQLFDMIDTNRSGIIGARELTKLGQTLQDGWTTVHSERLLQMMSGDPNGQLCPADFDQFITENLQKCYRTLDSNGDDQLDSHELEPLSRAFNLDHPDLLRIVGKNGNGNVGPDQFVQFVLERCLHGLQNGQVVKGLGAVLVMGGVALLKSNHEVTNSRFFSEGDVLSSVFFEHAPHLMASHAGNEKFMRLDGDPEKFAILLSKPIDTPPSGGFGTPPMTDITIADVLGPLRATGEKGRIRNLHLALLTYSFNLDPAMRRQLTGELALLTCYSMSTDTKKVCHWDGCSQAATIARQEQTNRRDGGRIA